jgi:hypothetical protein
MQWLFAAGRGMRPSARRRLQVHGSQRSAASSHRQMGMSKPSGPEHGDRHSPRPARGPDSAGAARRVARVGRVAIRKPASVFSGAQHRRSLPGAGAASSHPDTYAASGPGPGTWKDPDPRRRSNRGPGPQNRPACAALAATDACGLSRLNASWGYGVRPHAVL